MKNKNKFIPTRAELQKKLETMPTLKEPKGMDAIVNMDKKRREALPSGSYDCLD